MSDTTAAGPDVSDGTPDDEAGHSTGSRAGLRIEDLFGVAGKRAVVTGGSRGIGAMVAEGLVANGASVVVVARDRAAVDATTTRLGVLGDCTGVAADLTTEDGRAAVVDTVGDRLDLLVNNAGSAIPDPLGTVTAEGAAATFDLNVTAPLLLTQALAAALAHGTPADPARVVMVGSVDGIRNPAAPLFAYGASKAALHALTRQLAHSLAPQHVTVNAIAPGLFETGMTAGMLSAPGMAERIAASIPAGRIGTPADVAAAVIYLASRAGAYLNGAVIPVDGGVSTTHG
jgi:NAD(P)-dependent dehydrogenase (short-subunit alcohol dehydrogenase family)